MSQHAMIEIPTRDSLVAQTANTLRDGIKTGVWRNHLPGERVLCDRLQISRPTLRTALEALRKQGLIRVTQGKHRQIVPAGGKPAKLSNRVVGVVSMQPPHLLPDLSLFYLDQLRQHLQEVDYHLKIFSHPRLGTNRPHHILRDFEREPGIACWILLSTTKPVHEWFHKSGLPAFVVGSSFQDASLPSLDIDNEAICRHAVGVLLNHGHRNLAMLTRSLGTTAGDLASEEGFLDGINKTGIPDAQGVVVHHDTSKENICRKLDSLLGSATPPTGLLVCMVEHALAVLTYLSSKGVRIPQDISLISRDSDLHLSYVSPKVASYSFSHQAYADRLCRLVVELATTGILPLKHRRLMPEFDPGESVATAEG